MTWRSYRVQSSWLPYTQSEYACAEVRASVFPFDCTRKISYSAGKHAP